MYPYKFYGELTEWKGLDHQLNLCRHNQSIVSARQNVYYSAVGKVYQAREKQMSRAKLMRKQFLSGEAMVAACPTAVQPYLKLARYDKPIGYQEQFFYRSI